MAELNNTLFSDQELEDMKVGLFSGAEEKGPVTVLGMTFANDDERRAYFREELRKKLPELKLIEGFPIGSDDDIVNLSDPPFYTACPNPWLNDFVDVWETGKLLLEKKGERKKVFQVDTPYAADVSSIKNDSVYRSIVYHTKVPQLIVEKFLLHYTQPGDIVLDAFAGSGMTGLACQNSRIPNQAIIDNALKEISWGQRHCICADLSPYAETVAYGINTPPLADRVKSEIQRIEAEIDDEYGWMFTTKHNGNDATINCVIWSDSVICPNCGHEIVLWDSVVDKKNKELHGNVKCPSCGFSYKSESAQRVFETKYDEIQSETRSIIKSTPVRIIYTFQGKRYEKTPDAHDLKVLERIEGVKISNFPVDKLPSGYNTQQPVRAQGYQYVYDFYTKRNLIILSSFYTKILLSSISHKLLYLFNSMIIRSTKMNRVHFTKYLNGKSDWDAGNLKGTLYVPSFPVESSCIAQISNKLIRYLKASEELPAEYDNAISVSSASNIPIKDNSIDYIFVDPPFGANIMYSELNYISESWLKVKTNNTTEAIENEAQGKDMSFYFQMMYLCFKDFYRILKPGRWMTVEFSNTKASVWNLIQQSINKAGFVIANVSTLNKGQGGIRSISSSVAVKQDLAISCYKPDEEVTESVHNNFSDSIWAFVEVHLRKLAIPRNLDGQMEVVIERDKRVLYDRIVSFYVQRSLPVPMDASQFQKELSDRYIERDGMYFTADQAAEYETNRKNATGLLPMGLMITDEANGIAWLTNHLSHNSMSYQDLQPEWLQATSGVKMRSGDVLPELLDLLKENFIQEEDGKWRLPNIQDDVDKNLLRTKTLLKEYKLYVEQASKPKAKIKEVRVEAVRAGFKQCYIDKDFQTIVTVGDKIPQNLLEEDEILLQFYDIAVNHI